MGLGRDGSPGWIHPRPGACPMVAAMTESSCRWFIPRGPNQSPVAGCWVWQVRTPKPEVRTPCKLRLDPTMGSPSRYLAHSWAIDTSQSETEGAQKGKKATLSPIKRKTPIKKCLKGDVQTCRNIHRYIYIYDISGQTGDPTVQNKAYDYAT